MAEGLRPLPKNVYLTWGRGTKSFVSVDAMRLNERGNTYGGFQQRAWEEAPPGEQIPEDVALYLFHEALALAKKAPELSVHYIRIDHYTSPETPNNIPFSQDHPYKDIEYEGYTFRADSTYHKKK